MEGLGSFWGLGFRVDFVQFRVFSLNSEKRIGNVVQCLCLATPQRNKGLHATVLSFWA